MTLKARVARLERRSGAGLCTCRLEGIVVVRPGEADPPRPPQSADGSCPTCGGRVPDPCPQIVIHMPPNGRAAPEGEERWA